MSLAVCSEALMKVVPPRSSFSGKRRPRPGGVRNSAKTSSLRTPDEAADVIALEQEVARLRGIVNSFEAQKDHSLGLQEVQQHKCAVDVEVQTQNASSSAGDFPEACADDNADTCEAQRIQLDCLHQEVGDKSRELRRSQDTVRLLRSELKQQHEVSEQYRLQAEMLEEQLSRSNQRVRELETKVAEAAQLSRPRECERPFSAQLPRSWKERSRSGFSSDEEGETNDRSVSRSLARTREFCA